MITTGQWPDVYGNLMVEWGDEYRTYEPVGMELLKYRPNMRQTGKASSADFFSLAPDKPEGQAFAEEDPQQGYAIVWTQSAIGLSITLTEESFMFEQTLEMAEKVRGLAQATRLRREHDIAMRLRYAKSTTFSNPSGNTVNIAVADTNALIYDSHAVPNSSTTNDNDMNELPFNKPNLVSAMNKFPTFVNDKALKINGMRPTHVICSDDYTMNELVDRTIGSPDDPTTANRAINPVNRYGLKKLVIPGLQQSGSGAFDTTGAFYWFVACLPQSDYYMMEAQSDTPVFPKIDMTDPTLPITGDHKVFVRGTYSLFIRRYHWIVGSLATKLG